jgi:hypothetical protein
MTTRDNDRSRVARSRWVRLAWGSLLSGLAIVVALPLPDLNVVRFPPDNGGKHPGEAAYYVALFLASVVAGLAGLASLGGVRSKRLALRIIPVALLGIGINAAAAFYSYFSVAFVDFNPWPD